ncbi:FliH/SctL family protein [Oleidesulfovibrio sp.]|uniref:FliH/SctL family protein n=1 Tax=Oleidesulfovibrio sp. TaxID=2909707 RepID=UPI003A8C4B76
MSSSNDTSAKNWGTIYMGPSPMSERTLTQLEDNRNSPRWDENTEAEYLARVRARAEEMARSILDKANADATRIRQEAKQHGYEEGITQAQQELDEFRTTMGDSVSAVLGAIQAQCTSFFNDWRQELVILLRACVQRAVALELSAERQALLEAMFTKAAQALDSRRVLTIRCNPEDAPAVEDIVNTAKERMHELERWSVKPDATVQPGGLVIENADGMASCTVQGRLAVVDEILSQLQLPSDGPDGSVSGM